MSPIPKLPVPPHFSRVLPASPADCKVAAHANFDKSPIERARLVVLADYSRKLNRIVGPRSSILSVPPIHALSLLPRE